MIIAQEIDGVVVRHYSDANVMIRQIETGTLWPDAIDVIPCRYTYEETDISIPDEELDETEALNIFLGGAE